MFWEKKESECYEAENGRKKAGSLTTLVVKKKVVWQLPRYNERGREKERDGERGSLRAREQQVLTSIKKQQADYNEARV